MRSRLGVLIAVIAVSLAASAVAAADEGGWRVTSPRVRLTANAQRLELVIPAGRARGVTSRAIPIGPGQAYLAFARLDLDALIARGAFVRVALYDRPDGAGHQRLRLDSAAARPDDADLSVAFVAPSWARAAKLRVLARPDADETRVGTTLPALAAIGGRPRVVLRPDE